ncbi:MAG: cyclase family protein [Gemmatimonadaceae bacterium]
MFHDISIRLDGGVPEWPGDTPYSCRWTWQIASGASVNVSSLTMSPHCGTHADAPLHVRDGAIAADALPLDPFIGPALVLTAPPGSEITMEMIVAVLPRHVERLLLRTGDTVASGSFPDGWPALTGDCARALVERGLRLLGVDSPSVDSRHSVTLDVHHALFDGGSFIIENLDLRNVADGAYELIAPPQRLAALDAAPVRAVLRSNAASSTGAGAKGRR